MASSRITINGQRYDSPDEMPPDVRRTYEEAVRALGPGPASGLTPGSRQVLAGGSGAVGGDDVVKWGLTVNARTFGSIDELPPEVRRTYEDALRGATSPVKRPETIVHMSVNMAEPDTRVGLRETSDLESTIRGIPGALAFVVILGLIAWFLLSR